MAKQSVKKAGAVMHIPLELIDTAPQVRTKFGQAGIEELAADIKAHGVLQPLVVQQTGERFLLLIGERRLRACRFMGATTIPAIVASVSAEMAKEVQITENIQREDLSPKDLATAVHELWKKHKSVAAVAARLKKSPSWVSKRLALHLEVGASTCALMDGNVKDIELLYNFAKLEKVSASKARELVPAILEGKAGRDEIKAALLENPDEDADGMKDKQTKDLFEDTQQSAPSPAPIEAEQDLKTVELLQKKLQIAMAALSNIHDFTSTAGGHMRGTQARSIAHKALNEINGATTSE